MEEGAATVGVVLLREVSEAVVQLPPLPLRVSLFQAMVSFLPTPLPPAVVLIDVGLNFHQERACCCFLHSQKMQNAFQRSLLAALLHFVIWYLFDVFEQIGVVLAVASVGVLVFPALASGILLVPHLSP